MSSPHGSLSRLLGGAAERFKAEFAAEPMWAAAAPGRVNLIGEHVDYNDGFVLPMAIDRYTVLVAGPGQGRRMRLLSATSGQKAQFESTPNLPRGEPPWSNYLRGVIAGYLERGIDPGGFDAVIDSTVPVGGGLSSSAALEVATATLIEAMTQSRIDPKDKALLCQKAEREYAGVPCGIMDQFASTFGRENGLLLLDCRSMEFQVIPLDDPAVSVLIINSNVSHSLDEGMYARRRSECEAAAKSLGVRALRDVAPSQLDSAAAREQLDPVVYRRARHVVGEIERTTRTASAVAHRDWSTVGRLMYASHDSLRDDYEVSCRELDVLVDAARAIGNKGGVIGSRMTGAGFGGCTVTLVRTDHADAALDTISRAYQSQTGIQATGFLTRPARGAHELTLPDRG